MWVDCMVQVARRYVRCCVECGKECVGVEWAVGGVSGRGGRGEDWGLEEEEEAYVAAAHDVVMRTTNITHHHTVCVLVDV